MVQIMKEVPVLGKDMIIIGQNFIPYIIEDLLKSTPNVQNYAIITDCEVSRLYLQDFIREWNNYAANTRKLLSYVIPQTGETSKSDKQKSLIEEFLFSAGCGRDTCIIAFGGGVVGDLVGYIAATFMRGVPLIQIPTTLMAMVDSSIGGKNGINTPAGKNLIGTFWHPLRIYVDLQFLQSLPQREFSNGMAEIIKAAIVADNQEFLRLESLSDVIWSEVKSKEVNSTLFEVMLSAIKLKANIVSNDERESGVRELLNFGHTIGHGIEAILAPKLLHGECVSIGMCQETEIAVNLGKCSYSVLERLRSCLELYKLPTSLHDTNLSKREAFLPVNAFMGHLSADKKNRGGQKKIVFLSGIGTTIEKSASKITDEDILRVVAPSVQLAWKLPSENSSDVSLSVPGSKSISNRVLLLAALGRGPCNLEGLLHSEDTKWMTTALRLLTNRKFTFLSKGNILNVQGPTEDVVFSNQPHEIYLGNCGTAARFLTSVCVLVARDAGVPIILTGNKRMKERPIGPLVDALRSNGAEIEYLETTGCLPIKILPSPTGFSGGEIKVSAKLSSQYVSSLLMAAPYAKKDVKLELVGEHVSSQPYIDITLAVMESFGVRVERVSDRCYLIPAPRPYVNIPDYVVEGDASSATYPLAVAAITGTRCTVTNLGFKSLQGDAQFAKLVLERMGCKVEQNEMQTTVQGPPIGTLKAIPNINMETMTDAFLTASALAAVANGGNGDKLTTIVGIANTKVKECDRIAVCVEQLQRFGVDALEIDDGIQINGTAIEKLTPVAVDCYEDHRISMSFSILGIAVPGTIISDRHCVIKSWPGWWSALVQGLKIPIIGCDIPAPKNIQQQKYRDNASVVLVGMKRAGKTTLGKIAAARMGFKFIDLDDAFIAAKDEAVGEFIDRYGWEHFRDIESSLLVQILRENPTDTIIATGGGAVELTANHEHLKQWRNLGGLVIHIDSDWEEMRKDFEGDRASFIPYANLEPFNQVAKRRAHLYQRCSSYQFYRVGGREDVGRAATGLERLIRFARGELGSPLPPGTKFRSFFVCLAVPDISVIQNEIPNIMNGFHAVEVRVDHLRLPNTPPDFKFNEESLQEYQNYIARQICIVRGQVGSAPIIYTIRTVSEGGKIPDDIPQVHLESLYNLGLRLGCDLIDVQLSKRGVFASLDKGNSKIIASYHQLNAPLNWGDAFTKNIVKDAQDFGDAVKLVGKCINIQHNRGLEDFLNENFTSKTDIPLIAVELNVSGQSSRLLNRYLTPATHPSLPNNSAPGQLTLQQINQGLTILGQISPKKFFVFGHPVTQSKSPLLHNMFFKSVGLPHSMSLFDRTDTVEFLELLKTPDFLGSCVTMPFKEVMRSKVDVLSDAAKIIGSINTIYRDDYAGGILYGDNTDWIGILKNVKKALDSYASAESISPAGNGGSVSDRTAGFVFGAGGTARAAIYAIHKLGFENIYVYNRTKARLDGLIAEYAKSGIIITRVDNFTELQEKDMGISVIIDTCPAVAMYCSEEFVSDVLEWRNHRGAVVRMAYNRPDVNGDETDPTVNISGIEVLIDQAIEQEIIWTGLRPSRRMIEDLLKARA